MSNITFSNKFMTLDNYMDSSSLWDIERKQTKRILRKSTQEGLTSDSDIYGNLFATEDKSYTVTSSKIVWKVDYNKTVSLIDKIKYRTFKHVKITISADYLVHLS